MENLTENEAEEKQPKPPIQDHHPSTQEPKQPIQNIEEEKEDIRDFDFDPKTLIDKEIHKEKKDNLSESSANKRGRPRIHANTSEENLKEQIFEWAKDLVEAIKSTANVYRTDALDISIIRKIKNIPNILLHYICSRSHYKSKDLKKVIGAYLECFLKGFLGVFEYHGNIDLAELFLDFICIAFPKNRVEKILSLLMKYDSISTSQYKKYKEMVAHARATSLSKHRNLYKSNVCIQLICAQLPSILKDSVDPACIKTLNNTLSKIKKTKKSK